MKVGIPVLADTKQLTLNSELVVFKDVAKKQAAKRGLAAVLGDASKKCAKIKS